jgi:hypothetical protein
VSPFCSLLLLLCLFFFTDLRVTSGFAVERNHLAGGGGVGKTPNILSGQPLSPKSSKNKREEKNSSIKIEIPSNSDFLFMDLHSCWFGAVSNGCRAPGGKETLKL